MDPTLRARLHFPHNYYRNYLKKLPLFLAISENKAYNTTMKDSIIEKVDEIFYATSIEELDHDTKFFRWPSRDGTDLLHICERSNIYDGDLYPDTVFFKTGEVRWNYEGHYYCSTCKKNYKTKEELAEIWDDGEGNGEEGHA